jgi:diguanylate cyclase (GGDEF)-like protein
VLFIDLDHFKRINDQHGHGAGDTVLKAVAQCAAGQLRRGDLLGRIGGEEFCAFLPNTRPEDAVHVAEKLRQAIETLALNVDGRPLSVTASIGVAGASEAGAQMQTLQRQADQAMYRAKAEGRNRVSLLAV